MLSSAKTAPWLGCLSKEFPCAKSKSGWFAHIVCSVVNRGRKHQGNNNWCFLSGGDSVESAG